MFKLICLVLGYGFGCIQFAYILGKIANNIDIREFGSGNAGTTNVIRVMGWKAGVITFIGDFLKAVIAVLLCKYLFPEQAFFAGLYAGIGVIIGHNWPFYLKFKGGKGIAATIGTMLAVDPVVGLIAVLILAIVIIVTRYVSLGSILMTAAVPILFALFYKGHPQFLEIIALGLVITLFAFIRHRANIKRLLTGTESKIGQRSKKKVEEN